MGDLLRLGGPDGIDVRLRRHGRARRLVLRVSGRGGPPVLTVPAGATMAEVRAFALEHEDWIRRHLAARAPSQAIAPGVRLPVVGVPAIVAIGGRMRWDAAAATLVLPGPAPRLPAQAAAFLREEARAACAAAVERYAGRVGRRWGAIRLRDPRSRWGSCTARGDLMFSWRLAMAPRAVLDYVAAHEVAHLVELNHSSRFWTIVAELDPKHEHARRWLKANGAELHRYDFRSVAAVAAEKVA